jgi:hypothetical protein
MKKITVTKYDQIASQTSSYSAGNSCVIEGSEKMDASDGYHTFTELYDYRKAYNAAFFNELYQDRKYDVHKSKKHSDGLDCFGGGWFVVYAQLPTGQISNHYELKDWDLFHVEEREKGAVWDGHTPRQALNRLVMFLKTPPPSIVR